MNKDKKQSLVFFGCPMDCDEKYDSIQEKSNTLWLTEKHYDPLKPVMAILSAKETSKGYREAGSLKIPSWLLPNPPLGDRSKITSKQFIDFIDEDGCRRMAESVKAFVCLNILPDIPCMVGIDHSMTGGAFGAVTDYYGKDSVALIVIDTHTDAVPMTAHAGAIQYDMDTNPNSVYDPADPYLYNRPDSYNASSFLYHLLKDDVISPKNLFVLGVSDYPDKKTLRIKDPRIQRYTDCYAGLRQKGCTILTKKEFLKSPRRLRAKLESIRAPYVYISVDMDIGAMNALDGVRFRNWKGLNETKIYKLVAEVGRIVSQQVTLVGMDVMEMDPRRAGEQFGSTRDRTYEIAANIISKLVLE